MRYHPQNEIDILSNIDTYLLYEFTKNVDVGWGSFYMHVYEGDDKLYFGTPWDFDLALGNDNRLDIEFPEGLYVGNPDVEIEQRHEWFQELMKQEWYQEKVKDRWNEIKHIFLETQNDVLDVSNRYRKDFNKDQNLWKTMGVYKHTQSEYLRTLKTHEEHILHLDNWITKRYHWLDNYFNHTMLK